MGKSRKFFGVIDNKVISAEKIIVVIIYIINGSSLKDARAKKIYLHSRALAQF